MASRASPQAAPRSRRLRCPPPLRPVSSSRASRGSTRAWAACWRPWRRASWLKMASTLSDDTAPPASLGHLKAQAAPMHPGATPEPLGSSAWPQQPASACARDEDVSLSTTRRMRSRRPRWSPTAPTTARRTWARATCTRRACACRSSLHTAGPSTLCSHAAPPASLDRLKAQAPPRRVPERRHGIREARRGPRRAPPAVPTLRIFPLRASRRCLS